MRPSLTAVLLLLLLIAALALCGASHVFTYNQSLPPRLQWMENGGYCGEVSTAAAGLRWGQYLSQYDVRDIATGSQFKYYLVGENDIPTAIALRLNFSSYPNTCVPDGSRSCSHVFLSWVKYMARRGHSVTFTVYMNQWLFSGNPDYDAGNSDYDHIVSLYSWSSLHDDDSYYDDDVVTFSDHGLWNDQPRQPPPYLFTFNLSEFQGSRRQANAHKGNIYTLPDASKSGNFGIAHRGPADEDRALLPASIACSANFESPTIGSRSQQRPQPMPLQLTVTVSGTLPSVGYKAYIYTNHSRVPVSRFNARAADADDVVAFVGDSSGVFTFVRNWDSDRMFFVRVVRGDAP